MVKHKEWTLLSAYLDNELSSSEQSQVKSHLINCGECQADLNSFQLTKKGISNAPRLAMPMDLMATLSNLEVEKSPILIFRDWWTKPKIWIPAGGFATAIVLIGLLFKLDFSPQKNTIPLSPLLAAHSRYTAETLVPRRNIAISNFSMHLDRIDETIN